MYSFMSSFPAVSMILTHIWKLKSSLWISNKPRHVYLQRPTQNQLSGRAALCLRSEHRSAPVDGVCVVAVEVGDAFLQLVAALASTDAELEQVDIGIQRELVHRVHAAQVVEDGEEDRSSLGTRPVALWKEKPSFSICPHQQKLQQRWLSDLSGRVNHGLRLLAGLQLLCDLGGRHFAGLQSVDKLHVVQERTSGLIQQPGGADRQACL